MIRLLAGTLIVAAALMGCTKSSDKGGVAGSDTFTLKVPSMSTSVKQGEVQTVRLTLDRGVDFKERVKLETKAPPGLSVDPSSATIEPGDKGDVQLKVTAATDAPLGECKILVKGTPDKGGPTDTEIKITISAK